MPPKKSSKTVVSTVDTESIKDEKKVKSTKKIDTDSIQSVENNDAVPIKEKTKRTKRPKEIIEVDDEEKDNKDDDDNTVVEVKKTKKPTKKKSVIEDSANEKPLIDKPIKGGKKTNSKKDTKTDESESIITKEKKTVNEIILTDKPTKGGKKIILKTENIIEKKHNSVSKKEDTLLDLLMKNDQFNKEEKEKLNSIFELNKTEINKNALPIDTLKILWSKFITRANILQKEITTCETERDLMCKCIEIIMSSEQHKTFSEDILDKPTSSQKKIITKINKISNNLKNEDDDDDKTSNTTDDDSEDDSDSDDSDEDATSLEPIK